MQTKKREKNNQTQFTSPERGKTGVTADHDKIEFRLFNSSSIPGDEPSVTLAQLHNELSSRASTTINNAFNNLQRSEYLYKMGWIKQNPRRIQGVVERRQPVGQQQSDGMDYEDRQTSSRSAKLQTSRFQSPTPAQAVPRRSAGCTRRTPRRDPRSAETDAGEDPAEDEQANNVTFGHKMMYPAEPDWNITSDDFADEDLASLLRGDGKKKIDLVASMHMLKLQCLTAKLGKTAWNDLSSMHMPDKAGLGVLHSQIMAQELRTLNSTFVSSLRNNPFG